MKVAAWIISGLVIVGMTASCSSGSANTDAAAGSSSVTSSPTLPATTHRHAKKHHHRTVARHHHAKRHKRRAVKDHLALVPAEDVPNPRLTPGGSLPVTVAQVCTSGYASRTRDVSQSEKDEAYARYGVAYVPYQHEVDHLVSLEIGGSNAITNLWPEPYAGRWGARTKDVLENRLHDLVCDGRLGLKAAQQQEASNWVLAYERYVGGTPAKPTGSGAGGGGGGGGSSTPTSSGGFYASSYPSASTIYCADDSEWQDLSKTYLVHFSTFAQAHKRFPTYHLHQPC